ALQLFTGTGWTELRTAESDRWIKRGGLGPHPRDALLFSLLADEGEIRKTIDSDTLAAVLQAVAGSDSLVDRNGRAVPVSLVPFQLEARLVRGEGAGISVEVRCRQQVASSDATPDVRERSFHLAEVYVLPSVLAWIQIETGELAPLVAGGPGLWIERLQEDDLSELKADDLDRFLREGAELLRRLCLGRLETEAGLIREVEGVEGARIRLSGTIRKLSGRLELSYGGEWVEAPRTPEPWTIERDGEIRRYPPAGQSLARARAELESRGFRDDDGTWTIEGDGILRRILAPIARPFVELRLPESLDAFDWVERAPMLHLSVRGLERGFASGGAGTEAPGADEQREGAFRRPGGGVPWFEVSFTLVDGERELEVDLSRLREAMRDDPDGLCELGDGTVLWLGHDALKELGDLAARASIDERDDGGRAMRLPLGAVSELLDESPAREVSWGEGIRGLVATLENDAALEVPHLDPRVRDLLRPYQLDAVRWFHHLARWGLGGILADEMGLGKTLMALAHLFGEGDVADADGDVETRRRGGPVLVVCPTSLVFNWLDEARRFFPGLSVVGLHGLSSADREEKARAGADLFVTSYALLRRDRELWESTDLRAVVLDEGQHIKNAESLTAKAAFALRARERWVLTGTPVENHLGELWSLLHFTMPGFLEARREFDERWETPIRHGDENVARRLRARVRPFILRRTKEQVLGELPPRIEQVERVGMTRGQQALYEEYLRRARAEIDAAEAEPEARGARMKVLAALTRLRQVCCHPALVLAEEERANDAAMAEEWRSGKFELLRELLAECIDEGHRVLVFSQFTSMLDIIEESLREEGVRYSRLDGSTRDREGEVRRFQEDAAIPVFLISLKAGGHGLNLTQADTVIIYDPWWNPATEEQAAARAHRMGQTLPVHVHKLVTAGTVEEKIVELQRSKRELAESIISDGPDAESGIAALGFDELRGLLADG
ncbi:MAG TPA: DEAD/DEAH box helicase, partial [Planctomycetota bacterium]|nr:DEAD/DEAH box helicase [Planctomycetota bacterium]